MNYNIGPFSGLKEFERIVDEARRRGIEDGRRIAMAERPIPPVPQSPQEHAATSLLRSINDTLYRIEKALTMTGHKTRIKTGSTKTDANGKTRFVKADTAPPHVRAGRRRKANKIIGARAAK